MERLLQDLRYGARMLMKQPGFTLIAVIALALGIGANTAIFSVVNGVLLSPLPYANSDRLVMLWLTNPSLQLGVDNIPPSAAYFADWRDQAQVFESVSALDSISFNLTGAGEPEQIICARVSSSFFQLLAVWPEMGRAFSTEEDEPGNNRVVIVSHGLWQRRFGRDPDILGKPVTLNGNSYTVIGVMPAGFRPPGSNDLQPDTEPHTDLWMPQALTAEQLSKRGDYNLAVIARLKEGITLDQAQTEMNNIARRVEEQEPQTKGFGVKVISLYEHLVGRSRPALLVMLVAVSFVLLIACANVANLLLARAASRQKEIAVRMALGATRGRIVRQLLTESLLLSTIGGAAGAQLSFWGIGLLLALSPKNIPRLSEIGIDANVFGFTLLISIVSGVLFGLAPALYSSRPDPGESLKSGARALAGGLDRNRVRRLLVMSEVALSFVLLVGAGLMIESFVKLLGVDPGFDPDNVLTLKLSLPTSRYPEPDKQAAFFERVIERVAVLPGVESVGAVSALPLGGAEEASGFMVEGSAPADPANMPMVDRRRASPDYFTAMRIPLVKGRYFTEADNQAATRVAIISEGFARRFFPGEDPLGKRIKNGGPTSTRPWLLVVGVVKDVKHLALEAEARPQMYMPYLQNTWTTMVVVTRTTGDPAHLASGVRGAVWEVDKQQPVTDVKSMRQYLSQSIAERRLNMILLAVFACVALILAAVGLYGVMSYWVTQRTREIGIRLALGCGQARIVKLVVRQGMAATFAGVAAGAGAALVMTRLMESLLYGVSRTDPATFILISLMLMGVALAACAIPARRAAKVDPGVALRCE
jgi:putative ABC transport system permease protein